MKEEWKKVKLGEICKIGDGAHASLKRQNNGILYLTAKNITSLGLDLSKVEYIDEKTYEKHFSEKSTTVTCPKKGDILYSIIGSIGGCYLIKDDKEKIGISSSVAIFRPIKDVIDEKYLFYFLKSELFQQNVNAVKTGAAQGFMSLGRLSLVEISYPKSLPTQQKIASILSAYDDLIENNRRQIKLLEEAALKLYKEWFVKLNFPGHETTKIADGIPDGWIETTIGDIVKIKSGFSFKSEWWQEKGYPVVKIKDIGNNTLDITSFDFVSEERTLKCKDFLLNEGDLVIAMTGATIGKIGLVPKIDNLYTNQRVGKFFPNDKGEWQTPFLFCFYNSDSIQNQIIALSSSSSAQPNISGNQLESFKVILNKNLINLFNRITEPMFKKILKCQIEIQKCQLARDKLLPKLMNGEIEV